MHKYALARGGETSWIEVDFLQRDADRDIRTLASFIKIYCDNKHIAHRSLKKDPDITPSANIGDDDRNLCGDCQELLEYAIMRRSGCPLNPKPMCKKCKTHCYSKEHRSKIREVMRFSGAYLIKHGRFDLVFHYLL
ncbi:MAG: nitrous oxide-stimulated promoter family protein [archaeon]